MAVDYFAIWRNSEPAFPSPPAEIVGPLALPPLAQGALLAPDSGVSSAQDALAPAADEVTYRAWLDRGLEECIAPIDAVMIDLLTEIVTPLETDTEVVASIRDDLLNQLTPALEAAWRPIHSATASIGSQLVTQLTIHQSPIAAIRDHIHHQVHRAIQQS